MVHDLCRINYYKEGDYLYPKFDGVEAYRKAITTWGKWIDKNINPKKQIVYYRGYSSAHFRYQCCFLDIFTLHKFLLPFSVYFY
jgi:hypothetical protein